MEDIVQALGSLQNVVMDIPTTQVGQVENAKVMDFGMDGLYNVSEVCKNTFLVIQRRENLQIYTALVSNHISDLKV